MSDETAAGLRIRRRHADGVLASFRGEVTSSAAPALQKSLTMLLLKHSKVVLDISQARLSWAPSPELFLSAVTSAGGWPGANLVLLGADERTSDRLRACRITESVPLAATEQDAALLVGKRPARLIRVRLLPAHPSSVGRARDFVEKVCRLWDALDCRGRATAVVEQLVADAVAHTSTDIRLRLVLDARHLWISVRHHRPTVAGTRPGGLDTVAALSDSWGVLHYDDGSSTWAALEFGDRTCPPDPAANGRRAATISAATMPVAPPGNPVANGSTSAMQRQHFVCHDVEQAHEFMCSTYCRHSPQLSGARDSFQLEYTVSGTSSFALERLSHTMALHGQFEPFPALLVAGLSGQGFQIGTGRASYRAAAGDLFLVAPDLEYEVGWTHLDMEGLRLDPAAVAAIAAEVSGIDAEAVRFTLSRPVSKARARHWRSLVRMLRDGVLHNEEVLASPLSRSLILRQLATTLIETFPNPALDALTEAAPTGWVEPGAIRRASVFIEEHAVEDIGLADIARAARIGPRALQMAFRRHRDVTPLEYLRRVRLERAHRDLVVADPTAGDTVAAIANRWGFAHHGYFSAAYRRIYGHPPHVTLRS